MPKKRPQNGKKFGIVDLFSGVGGLSLGAARAGFALLGAIDNDPQAVKAHKINFPNCEHWPTDIASLSGDDVLSRFCQNGNTLSGIVGGPPCQGFSLIGHKNEADARNRLFVHFFRIVGECKPSFFLAENVPGILSESNDRLRETALSFVKREYTLLPPMKLSASDYGAPTSRTRIFFFGYLPTRLNRLEISNFQPSEGIKKIFVRDALRGLPKKINPAWQEVEDGWRRVRNNHVGEFGRRLHSFVPDGVGDKAAIKKLKSGQIVSGCLGTHHSREVQRRFAKLDSGMQDSISKSRRLEASGFCHTLRAGTNKDYGSYQAVRPIHPTENRVITPREAARLQGFPDWFQFDATKWHSFRQIGNSVSPILAEYIFKIILGALIDKETSNER